MGDPVLVGILDRLIAVIQECREGYRQELISEIKAHAESPVYNAEDFEEDAEDEQLRVFDKMLEDATGLREKVIAGETS